MTYEQIFWNCFFPHANLLNAEDTKHLFNIEKFKKEFLNVVYCFNLYWQSELQKKDLVLFLKDKIEDEEVSQFLDIYLINLEYFFSEELKIWLFDCSDPLEKYKDITEYSFDRSELNNLLNYKKTTLNLIEDELYDLTLSGPDDDYIWFQELEKLYNYVLEIREEKENLL